MGGGVSTRPARLSDICSTLRARLAKHRGQNAVGSPAGRTHMAKVELLIWNVGYIVYVSLRRMTAPKELQLVFWWKWYDKSPQSAEVL